MLQRCLYCSAVLALLLLVSSASHVEQVTAMTGQNATQHPKADGGTESGNSTRGYTEHEDTDCTADKEKADQTQQSKRTVGGDEHEHTDEEDHQHNHLDYETLVELVRQNEIIKETDDNDEATRREGRNKDMELANLENEKRRTPNAGETPDNNGDADIVKEGKDEEETISLDVEDEDPVKRKTDTSAESLARRKRQQMGFLHLGPASSAAAIHGPKANPVIMFSPQK